MAGPRKKATVGATQFKDGLYSSTTVSRAIDKTRSVGDRCTALDSAEVTYKWARRHRRPSLERQAVADFINAVAR